MSSGLILKMNMYYKGGEHSAREACMVKRGMVLVPPV
jgi:hypothetical protein